MAALAGAGEGSPDPAAVLATELEVTLARRPELYLVLDPARRVLEIKARGIVLDSVPLLGIEVVTSQPLLRHAAVQLPKLPAVWTVEEGPGDSDRDVIAPSELRPYGSSEEEPDEQPVPRSRRTPVPTPTPVPEPPVSYRCHLDSGWDLWITENLPPQGLWLRAWAAVRDGWARLWGRAKELSPAVTLAVAPEDGKRLHHLMRTGIKLLITASSPQPPPPPTQG